jgi:ABC-2 type transport system ATP-binding protein
MIKAENVTKTFEDFTALSHITCTIPQGCIYGMVGSNGAGKSTFLRLITGVYKADEGSLTIDGKPVFENPEVKSLMAYVPDELYFLPGSSMDRMAALYAAIYPGFDKKRYQALTQAFQLNPKKSLNTFSKGMRRQAATILAVSARPQYIFFDETFDGLDPVMRNLVKNLICQDVLERQATAIITSHSLRELEDTCDQLALLHKGGLVLESDIQNLKTSLFKIQIAFSQEYDRGSFEGIDILHFSKRGSVANMIVRGGREETVSRLQLMAPILMDVLPLSLEEVFTYEMEALGYAFGDVLEA